jgi:hypothetical protein
MAASTAVIKCISTEISKKEMEAINNIVINKSAKYLHSKPK